MRMPTVCYALNQASLLALLLEAKVYTMQEASLVLNQGFNVSFVPQMPGAEWAAAAVEAPSDEAYALIEQMFKDNINIANSPVKIKFIGQPDVEPSITRRQLREALSDMGLLEAVETAVGMSPTKVQIWYADSPSFLKSAPMVQDMAANLKVTPEQLDALWALGATK